MSLKNYAKYRLVVSKQVEKSIKLNKNLVKVMIILELIARFNDTL